MTTQIKKRRIYLCLTILMTSLIWINSLLPANLSSTQSGFFTQMIQSFFLLIKISVDIDQLSFLVRKSAHFAQFFLLGIFWFQYLYYKKENIKKFFIYALLFCLITAIMDESIQLFSEGRAFQFLDIFIDILGSLVAILTCLFFHRYKKNQGESI